MLSTNAPQPTLHPPNYSVAMSTPNVEPLPLYTPTPRSRDPETESILSAAPSYHSDSPEYDQSTTGRDPTVPLPLAQSSQQQQQQQRGLPPVRYAPGFIPRSTPHSAMDLANNFNIMSWSQIRQNPIRKQYENVARRRSAQHSDIMSSLRTIIDPVSSSPGTSMESSRSSISAGAAASAMIAEISHTRTYVPAGEFPAADTTQSPNTPQGILPNEDPHLVGHAAAERARAQRQYRETLMQECDNTEQALRIESAAWDFMLSQMVDWEARERSWRQYRERGQRRTFGGLWRRTR